MSAPNVAARETRKPEFPATVHAYTDALRELVDGPHSAEALAQATGRVPSNVRRDVHKLRDAGVIEFAGKRKTDDVAVDTWKLTDKGRRWVQGVDLAEGKADPSPLAPRPSDLPVWPIDQLVANPTNRRLTDADIDSMADSIAAQGILQPLTVSPPDDRGYRTIWIGHRRWRGAERAREEGRLPASLAAGLPFVERDATPAEAIAMTVIENVERQDIPPLELAFLLRDYADAAGSDGKPLDAKAVAAALGLGVRDVQDKIRIARNATPEALAAYAEDHSWDRLRDSVTEKKAAAVDPEGPQSEWWQGNDRRIRLACDALKPRHLLALVEIADKCLREPAEGYRDHATLCSKIGEDRGVAQHLIAEAGIGFSSGGGAPWTVNVSEWTWGWLKDRGWVVEGQAFVDPAELTTLRGQASAKVAEGEYATPWLNPSPDADPDADPLVVNGHRYPNLTRANEARRAAGLLPNPSNHGGGYPKATDSDDPNIRAMGQDWDRMRSGADVGGDATPSALAPRPSTPSGLAALTNDPDLAPARLALIEIAHKIGDQRRPLDPVSPAVWTGDADEDFTRHGCTCGAYWLDAPVQSLIQLGAARVVQIPGGHPPMLTLTPEGLAYLLNYGCTLPISGAELVKDQTIAGLPANLPGARISYATACLEVEAAAPVEAGIAIADDADTSDDVVQQEPDLWDRDAAAIAADEALLDRVRAFAGAEPPLPAEGFRELWRALGLDPEVVVNQAGTGILANPIGDGEPVEIVTANADGSIPDERASAIAWLVAWAVEQALKTGAE